MGGGDERRLGPSPAWLRWVHRIGYVSTALVFCFGLFFAFAIFHTWSSPLISGRAASFEGGLDEAWREWSDHGGSAVLAALPGRDAMHGSGLRLVIMPSFSDWFGLAVHADPGAGGTAVLSHQQKPPWNPDDPLPPVEIERHAFALSAREHADFLEWFDEWAGRNSGEQYWPCLDGTAVAFERIEGAQVLAGRGNCERHYDELRQHTLALVKRHLPEVVRSLSADWHDDAAR